MKRYCINARNGFEDNQVKVELDRRGIMYSKDGNNYPYVSYTFRCKKRVWKEIKSEFNLIVTTVVSQFQRRES